MKHETKIVSGHDLLNQWKSSILTASEHAGFHISPAKLYRVSWADPVLTCRYNTTCTILGAVEHD